MNIALPALVAFIVLLPGFIARSRIKFVEQTSLDYSPFGRVVSEAVMWALVLHVAWIYGAQKLTGDQFMPEIFLGLLSSSPAPQSKAIEFISNQPGGIVSYFISLLAFSFLAPSLVRRFITKYRLDRSESRWAWLFRFDDAPWYYILTGADYPPGEEPDFVVVSAIVDVAKQPILYRGVLEDFFFDENGQLDRLVLSKVMRRPLIGADKPASEDLGTKPLEDRFYQIDGDTFIIRYADTITLNIQYVNLVAQDEKDEQALLAS